MTPTPQNGLLSWVDRWLPADVTMAEPEERLRRRLLVAYGLLVFVTTLPWYVWMLAVDPSPRLPRMVGLATSVLLAANPLWLRLLGSRQLAWATLLLLHFAVGFNIALNGGLVGPVALALMSLPVVSTVLLGPRLGWVDAGLVFLFALGLEHLASTRALPTTAPPEIWPLVRIMSLAVGLGFMLLAVAAYVELSHRQARELVEARDGALAASRAKSQFLSTMSHELRTPMVGVMGAAELLARTPMSGEQHDLVALLRQSAAAQLELIGSVLDLARIEADRLELEQLPTSPRQLIAEVEALFRAACRAKGLELRAETDPGLPGWVLADPLRLRQVLSNLVANAVKFTERGTITLRASALGDGQAPRLRFEVIDTGIGFAPEHGESLFEAFRQGDESTTRRFGGSGLGLAICRRLVEAMRGTIGAASTPGAGSVFRFEIPAPPSRPPTTEIAVASLAAPRRGLTILLADDDPINRAVLSAMLETLGHTTLEAIDGRTALELCSAHRVDLVILDMHMPELDGPGCAEQLRRLPGPVAAVPILGLTADAIVDNHQRYLESGLDAIYSKPISLEQLEIAIAEALGKSRVG